MEYSKNVNEIYNSMVTQHPYSSQCKLTRPKLLWWKHPLATNNDHSKDTGTTEDGHKEGEGCEDLAAGREVEDCEEYNG